MEIDDEEVVRLLREMRRDLDKLTRVSAKAGRRNRAFFDSFERGRFWRRAVVTLLAIIAIVMIVQTFIMLGYGTGSDDSGNSETTQRIHLRG